MPLSDLSTNDKHLILHCMQVILDGSFLPNYGGLISHFEFHTRLGLTEQELREVIDAWPNVDDSARDSNAGLAINNCLNEIAHGVSDRDLKRYPEISREDISRIYKQWSGGRGGIR